MFSVITGLALDRNVFPPFLNMLIIGFTDEVLHMKHVHFVKHLVLSIYWLIGSPLVYVAFITCIVIAFLSRPMSGKGG